MRIIGIDPSSSKSGVALVVDGELKETDCWFSDKNKSSSENLVSWYFWLGNIVQGWEPHMAAIEFLSVQRNANTTRKISHFQAVAALVCKLRGLVVVEGRVSSARKISLGKGNYSKDESFKMVKDMWPDHKFKVKNKGGDDETDGVVLAMAGPSLAEK